MKPYYEQDGITIYNGNCLEVLSSLGTLSVDSIVTDPPYGIDYQSARRTDSSQWKPKIANDKKPFIWWLYEAARVVAEPGAIACFCRWDVQDEFYRAMDIAGFEVKSQVIWDREAHGMGDLGGAFAPQHDVIWFGVRGDFQFHGARPKSVIRHLRLGGEQLVHPNEKPVSTMAALVNPLTPPGGTVLDCFMGVGPTLIAAKNSGRRAIGIEIEERYCEIAAHRLAQGVLFGVA